MRATVGTAVSGAVAWIAGLVAIWSLAGFTAVTAYRRGQIESHRCLAELPIPVNLFQVGVVALMLAVGAGIVTVFLKNGQSQKLIVCIFAGYVAVMVPLLVASVASYTGVRQPEPMAHTACISGDDAVHEGDG